ncbi:zinc finger family protein [Dorcoceras hygrometricum]|uniref:Zinc finger family protein n=1 Tax=Dorcoceras hygrometricum TaxID=472368 RepID=A0A2Z7B9W3_9LAMI|nr:zinc finger family protein [Dorcoceras hygrometricum]
MMTSAVTSAISRKLQRKPAVGTGRSVVELEKKPALTNKEFSSWTFSKANPAADNLATQIQQRRKFSSNEKFSSDAGFIFSTQKNQHFSTQSKVVVQKASPWKVTLLCSVMLCSEFW